MGQLLHLHNLFPVNAAMQEAHGLPTQILHYLQTFR